MFADICLDLRTGPWAFFVPMLSAREVYIESVAWRRGVRHTLNWTDGVGNAKDIVWLRGFRNFEYDGFTPAPMKRKAPPDVSSKPSGVRGFYALMPTTRAVRTRPSIMSDVGELSPQY
jgi:hypothetical protein